MLFFLSIFIGEYLWIHLVQQRRLILRQTGIFTFGVSSPFFSPPLTPPCFPSFFLLYVFVIKIICLKNSVVLSFNLSSLSDLNLLFHCHKSFCL